MNNTNFWIKTLIFGLRSTLFDPKMSIWNQKYAITSRNQYYSLKSLLYNFLRPFQQWCIYLFSLIQNLGFPYCENINIFINR